MNTPKPKGGGYFPRKYVTDMLRWFHRNNDQIQVITYHDLKWPEKKSFIPLADFAAEKLAWSSWLNADPTRKNKVYVLIQYDVDSIPERSNQLIADQAHDHVPANVMIFIDRINRALLKETGKIEFTDYDVDKDLLKRREKDDNWQIGYHSNAHEKSGFNMQQATEIIAEDVTKLREEFTVNYYTAHGGIPCGNGKNNNSVPAPKNLNPLVRWVHNGSTPHFDAQFSDGGHNSPQRDPVQRDIRDFVKGMKPGKRYRILLHPQYYDDNFSLSKRYSGTKWYDDMVNQYNESPQEDIWKGISLFS